MLAVFHLTLRIRRGTRTGTYKRDLTTSYIILLSGRPLRLLQGGGNTCINQSTDSTGGSIVSGCRLGNGPECDLKTISFNP